MTFTASPKNEAYYPRILEAYVSAFSALPEDDPFYKLISKSPWDGPVRLDTRYYLPHTQASRKKGTVICSVKPDLDNMTKSIMDCLEKEIWFNDSRVFAGTSMKLYDDGEGPRTECKISLYKEH